MLGKKVPMLLIHSVYSALNPQKPLFVQQRTVFIPYEAICPQGKILFVCSS